MSDNTTISTTTTALEKMKQQIAKNIMNNLFSSSVNKYILYQFLQANADEVVPSVHDDVSFSCFSSVQNYYMEFNSNWLSNLFIEQMSGHKVYVFCFKCSFFNFEQQFVAVLHHGIPKPKYKHKELWYGQFIVRNAANQHLIRNWFIQSLWNDDTEQNEYYFAWVPEEVLSDVFDFLK